MKKFAIIFGKDPEEIGGLVWPDTYENSAEFNKKFVAGKFETDFEDMFWQMFAIIRLHPCSMWYWVFYEKQMVVSGAIDPEDVFIINEQHCVPEWIIHEMDMMDASWDNEKYANLYNELYSGGEIQ